MQKKKKKNKLFIFLIICFVLVPFLLTKGCNYIESLNQAKNSVSEPITSISEQIQPSARVYTHAHTPARTHSRTHNAHVYAQMHSISKANWTGTAVPNSGYVNKIYFNGYSDAEENFNILTQLNYVVTPFSQVPIYVVFANSDLSRVFFLSKDNAQKYGIIFADLTRNIINNVGQVYYNDAFSEYSQWTIDSKEFEIDATGISNYEGIPIGQQNELINFLSITPFEQSSNNELSIGNLFSQIGNAIIIFGGAVVNVFISMEPIFWNEGPTLIFILLIASVSFALVFWGIELLISLIGISRTKRKKKK